MRLLTSPCADIIASIDPVQVVERLVASNIADAGAPDIPGLFHQLRQITGWAATIEAQLARRAGELEATGAGIAADDAIARGTKSSQRAARRATRRGDVLGQAPDVERQLAKGRVSAEHVDVLANAAAKLSSDVQREALFAHQADLAAHAAAETPGQFARTIARTVRDVCRDDGLDRSERQRKAATLSYGVNDETGMGWIRGELHPDDYQRVKRRLDAEVKALAKLSKQDGLDRSQLAARALVGLTTSARATSQPPAEVMVLIDLPSLIDGLHAMSVCEYSDGPTWPTSSRCVRIITTGSTRVDGDCNSTRAPENSSSSSPTAPSTADVAPTCSSGGPRDDR